MKAKYIITLPDGSKQIRCHRPSTYPMSFAIAWFDHKRRKWSATVYPSFQDKDKMLAAYAPELKACLADYAMVVDRFSDYQTTDDL